MLPHIAADPSRHDEDAEAIGFVEEFLAIHFAFQANGVQTHVLDVGEVGIEPLGIPAKKKIGGPGRTANEDSLAIYFEETATFGA